MFNEVKSLLKHSSVYGLANLLQKGIGFIMIPIYTFYLSPADYGILELMDLTINVITMLIGMGLGSAIIRFYYHYDNPADRIEVFTTSFIFTALLSILAVITLELFARPISGIVLGKVEYSRYFQVIFVSMALQTIASVPENLLLAKKRSLTFSMISVGTLISYLTFNILFLVVFKMGIMGILVSMLITKVLNTSSLLIITFYRVRLVCSFKKLKEMIGFGLPLVPAGIGMFIMHFSDRFFVQKFCNLEDVGLYSLGYKFGMILSVIVSAPIFRIWDTQRFEIANTNGAKEVFSKIFTYYSALVIFAGLGISIFIKEIISLMAASEYHGAAAVVPLIVLSYIFYGIANFYTLGIMISNKTKYVAYIQLSMAGINIIFNMFFISHFGVMGAAISTVLTFLLLAVLNYVVSQKLYPIPLEYGRVFVLFALSFSIFGLSCLVGMPLLISIGAKSLLLIAFPAALFWGKFFYEDEITKGTKLLKVIAFRFEIGRRFLNFSGQLKK